MCRLETLIIGWFLVFTFAASTSAELIYGTGIGSAGESTHGLLKWDSASPEDLELAESGFNPGNIDTFAGNFGHEKIHFLERGVLYRDIELGFTATLGGSPPTVGGVHIGFDINPVTYQAHVVTDLNQHFVFDVQGPAGPGALPLFYAAGDSNEGKDPNVVHLAYTNNVIGAMTTQLYGIDSALDILVTMDDVSGNIHTVGPLGIDVTGSGGFDISGATGIAYAGLLPANSSQSILYTINLDTGAATSVGPIGAGMLIRSIAVRPLIPEPSTSVLLCLAMIGLANRRARWS